MFFGFVACVVLVHSVFGAFVSAALAARTGRSRAWGLLGTLCGPAAALVLLLLRPVRGPRLLRPGTLALFMVWAVSGGGVGGVLVASRLASVAPERFVRVERNGILSEDGPTAFAEATMAKLVVALFGAMVGVEVGALVIGVVALRQRAETFD